MAGCTQAALPRAVNLSGFSREVDPPPWQGEAARPVQACLCAPSVWSRRSPGAGQASRRRRRRERNGRKRRAGRGRGGGAEDSAEALGTGLSLSATRRLPHPRGVLVRSLSFQPRLSSLLGTSLLTQPHSTSLPCPRLLKRMEILKL